MSIWEPDSIVIFFKNYTRNDTPKAVKLPEYCCRQIGCLSISVAESLGGPVLALLIVYLFF